MSSTPTLWNSLVQIIQLEKEVINLMISPILQENENNIGKEHNPIEYYENMVNEYLNFVEDNFNQVDYCVEFLERYYKIKRGEYSNQEKYNQFHELFLMVKRESTEEFIKHVLLTHGEESSNGSSAAGWEKKCLAFESKMKNRILTLATQQYSMVYGIAAHECPLNNSQQQQSARKNLNESSSLMACIYACMILHDENLPIQSDSILKIVQASNIEILPVYASMVAKYLKEHSLMDILGNLEVSDNNAVAPAIPNINRNTVPYGIELSEYGIDEDQLLDLFD